MARSLGVSAKRLLGWEPIETTTHEYDDAGRLVRSITTREPEWDDLERDRMRALAIYESGVCRCGFHESLTGDRENHFTIETKTCPVCRSSDRYARIQRANDRREVEAMGDNPPPGQPRPEDGRRTVLRRMSATEVAERRSAGPRP